jgi:hypothetical protein
MGDTLLFSKFSLNYPVGMAIRPIRSRPNNGPITLHPLKFEDAVTILLKPKPEPKKPKGEKEKPSD